jgi:hypothetical protein
MGYKLPRRIWKCQEMSAGQHEDNEDKDGMGVRDTTAERE